MKCCRYFVAMSTEYSSEISVDKVVISIHAKMLSQPAGDWEIAGMYVNM